MSDNIKSPVHYMSCSLECKDIIQVVLGVDGYIKFCKGNILKYLWRFKYKNGIEDLRKAKQYIEMAREKMAFPDYGLMEMQDLVERYSREFRAESEGDNADNM